MSGGGGDIKQTNEPPRWLQPYLQFMAGEGKRLYEAGPREYYPGNTVAPMPANTQQGIFDLAGFGTSGYNQGVLGNAAGSQNYLSNLAFNPAYIAGATQVPGTVDFLSTLRAGAFNKPSFDISSPYGTDSSGTINNLMTATRGSGLTVPDTPRTRLEKAGAGVGLGELTANPGESGYADQLIQRILAQNNQDFMQNVLPSIRNQQEFSAGGYGGSRQGVAEGIGLQGLADANADAVARTLYQARESDLNRQLQLLQGGAEAELARRGQDRQFGLSREQLRLNTEGEDYLRQLQAAGLGGQLGIQGGQLNLQAQTAEQDYLNQAIRNALSGTGIGTDLLTSGLDYGFRGAQSSAALAPGVQQLGLTGPQMQLAAGDIENVYSQALINEMINRFNYNRDAPWNDLANYSSILQGTAGLGYGQQTQQGGGSGGVAGALGGAATAAGILGGMNAMGGSAATFASGAGGWALLALGALAGYAS